MVWCGAEDGVQRRRACCRLTVPNGTMPLSLVGLLGDAVLYGVQQARISEASRMRRCDGATAVLDDKACVCCLPARTGTCSLRVLAFPHIEASLGHGLWPLGGQQSRGTTHHRAGRKERGAGSKEQEEAANPHWSGEAASSPVFDHHRSSMDVWRCLHLVLSSSSVRPAPVGEHHPTAPLVPRRAALLLLVGASCQVSAHVNSTTTGTWTCRCCRPGRAGQPCIVVLCACHAVDQITYLPACRPALPWDGTQGPRDPGEVGTCRVVAQSASLPKHNFPGRHLFLFWPARRARP